MVLIVRHAEKAVEGGWDPGLSTVGETRAGSLLEAVQDAGVSAIYTSQLRRTRATADPLARHLHVTPTEYAISPANLADYPAMVAEDILTEHRGEAVLVVSHSNLIPPLIEALGGRPGPAIGEEEYNRLYVVVIPDSGPVRTVRTVF